MNGPRRLEIIETLLRAVSCLRKSARRDGLLVRAKKNRAGSLPRGFFFCSCY
jgi:hypothetical protein